MITSSACIRPPPSAHLDQDEGQRQRHRRCGARRAGGGQLPRGRAGVAHDEVAVRSLLLGQLLQQGVPQLMRRHTGHLRRMPPLRPFGALRLQGGQGLQVEAVAGMTPGGSGARPQVPVLLHQARAQLGALGAQLLAAVLRRGRQALPADLLLVLADDVHGHEHVERVVHAAPDVLLVICGAARRACTRSRGWPACLLRHLVLLAWPEGTLWLVIYAYVTGVLAYRVHWLARDGAGTGAGAVLRGGQLERRGPPLTRELLKAWLPAAAECEAVKARTLRGPCVDPARCPGLGDARGARARRRGAGCGVRSVAASLSARCACRAHVRALDVWLSAAVGRKPGGAQLGLLRVLLL